MNPTPQTRRVTGYATVNSFKMYCQIYGNRQPWVLLHGACMTLDSTFWKNDHIFRRATASIHIIHVWVGRFLTGYHPFFAGGTFIMNNDSEPKAAGDTQQPFSAELEIDLPPKLGRPAQRALTTAGYVRLEQLAKVREAQVRQLHGMGPKALDQLRHALAAKGLSFADAAKTSP